MHLSVSGRLTAGSALNQVRADGGSVPWAPPAQHRLPEELGCGRGQQGLLESRRQAGTPAGAQPALQAQLVWLLPSLHVLWQYEVAGRPLAILSRGECPASSLLRQDTRQMSGSKAVPCVLVQRVYGVTFPDKKLMEEYKKRDGGGEEARPFAAWAPIRSSSSSTQSPRARPFFLPRGMTICRRLIQVLCAHLSASTCQAHMAHAYSTPSCPRMRSLRGTSCCSLSKAVLKPKRPLISECKHPWLYRCSSSMQTVLGFCLILCQNMAACCHKQHTLISAALSMRFCTEVPSDGCHDKARDAKS